MVGATYKTFIDARAVGSEIVVSDFTTLTTFSGLVMYRILELPLNVITPPSLTKQIYVRAVDSVTHVPTGEVFTAVTAPTSPTAGQFQIDPVATFNLGTIVFNGADGGITVEIIVTGRGSLLYSSDVNDAHDELGDARNGVFSVGTRLGLIEAGTNIVSGAIKPRHISTTNTDNFAFPKNVTAAGKIGIGTVTPDASAALDVTSTTGGILYPRMTSNQRAAIVSPTGGLQVFDIDMGQWMGFNGVAWVTIA